MSKKRLPLADKPGAETMTTNPSASMGLNGAATSPAAAQADDNDYVGALKKLKQPYNPVVVSAIKLLSQRTLLARWKPEILEYSYSECPLVDGHWFRPGSKEPEHGPVPLGVVLDRVFEVGIRDKWEEHNTPKQRLIAIAMLTPGALFGKFEFCDLLASTPSLRNYEVSAGSRAFKIVRRETDALRKCSKVGAPVGLGKKLQGLGKTAEPLVKAWIDGGGDDELVRAFRLENSWTAKILLLTQIPVQMLREERDFLDVVQNAAWQQSRHLREGHLKWLRHDLGPKQLSSARSATSAAISKFRRKLELATAEECVVFGTPPAPPQPAGADQHAFTPYGPLKELVEKINETLSPPKKKPQTTPGDNQKGVTALAKKNERVLLEDVLVPLFLHDTGQPCYLSLSDDALVFGKKDDYTELRDAANEVARYVAGSVDGSCQIREATVEGGHTDPFWRGTVELTSRFPEPYCLVEVQKLIPDATFADSAIVIAQHLLEETGSLIQAVLKKGADGFARNVFVIGKPYSSNVRVLKRIRNLGVHVEGLLSDWNRGAFESAWHIACQTLWAHVQKHLEANPAISKVLILDDGGMLHRTVPDKVIKTKNVVGVEQTSKGLEAAGACTFPVVGVACSAAKKRLEPTIVAETVWRKLETVLPQACAARTMAVCGLGNVGSRLATFIIDKIDRQHFGRGPTNRRLVLFDSDGAIVKSVMSEPALGGRHTVVSATSLAEVFEQAEVIFGCSGADLTAGLQGHLDAIDDQRTRYLISCSSFDVEFASLLKKASVSPGIMPFDLAQYENGRGTSFLIPQAGFPITFDRAPCAAPIELMQMTRGLLLGGLAQAAELAEKVNGNNTRVPLDSKWQIAVVEKWQEAAMPSDEKWIWQARKQCLTWWNPSPGKEPEFVEKHSAWPEKL